MRAKRLLSVTMLALAFLFSTGLSYAQKRGPSTPEERAKAVQLIDALEAEPLHKNGQQARRWLLIWLADVPDISVTMCTDYFAPLYKEKDKEREKKYAAEIITQMPFSSAAFIVEHPEQAKDDVAVNKAGLEGSLKAYEAILKIKPEAKWPFLDQLIERRDKGTLEEYVREISTTKCKGSKK